MNIGTTLWILKTKWAFLLFRFLIRIFRQMEESLRLKKGNRKIMESRNLLHAIVRGLYKQGEISFLAVPEQETLDGYNWTPERSIRGTWLLEILTEDPQRAIEMSFKIAEDYRKVVREYRLSLGLSEEVNLQEDRQWLFGSLLKWSGPIVEAGHLKHSDVSWITKTFEQFIDEQGVKAFGFAHGNIIGDCILVAEGGTFLFGMQVVPRPGRYYDFLRALDWFILKTPTDERTYEQVFEWIHTYIPEEYLDEAFLVFGLRCIGILGWDMIHRGDLGEGDPRMKTEVLLRFIRFAFNLEPRHIF